MKRKHKADEKMVTVPCGTMQSEWSRRNAIPATLARLERAALALSKRGGGFIFDYAGKVKSIPLAQRLESAIDVHAAWLKKGKR